MHNKKTIAVFFGGKSTEHDISIITAYNPIIQTLQTLEEYNTIPIYISKDGNWYSDAKMNNLEYFKDTNLKLKLAKLPKIQLSLNNGLSIIHPGILPKVTKIDIAFPAMHGANGEDGSLTGLLRLANIPFIGCDIFASTVAMDKALTKQILASEGINTVPHIHFTKHDWETNRKKILKKIETLNKTLFVKPVHLGSSIAISKTKTKTELLNAIEVAFHYDNKILIENSIENLIEITLPILGNNSPTTAITESPKTNTKLFDFNSKYLSGNKTNNKSQNHSELPAKINKTQKDKIHKLARQVYKALNCEGTARIDFLIDKNTNKIYVNEVNVLPGSLYHHNWNKKGLSNQDLIKKLITLAEQRHHKNTRIKTTFKSKVLSK